MTKEELKQEAEESFEKYRVTDIDYVVSPYADDEGEKKLMFNDEYDAEEEYFRLYSNGYLASAEPREKRISELEAQINKMRNCCNCKYCDSFENPKYCDDCKKLNKWELAND